MTTTLQVADPELVALEATAEELAAAQAAFNPAFHNSLTAFTVSHVQGSRLAAAEASAEAANDLAWSLMDSAVAWMDHGCAVQAQAAAEAAADEDLA